MTLYKYTNTREINKSESILELIRLDDILSRDSRKRMSSLAAGCGSVAVLLIQEDEIVDLSSDDYSRRKRLIIFNWPEANKFPEIKRAID